MSNLISTQEAVTKIVDTAIRKILSGEQNLTKEYEQSVKDAVNLILNTARRTEQSIIRCKDCRFASTYFYCGEVNWTCDNAEDGLGRDVSENSYCSSAIERKKDE